MLLTWVLSGQGRFSKMPTQRSDLVIGLKIQQGDIINRLKKLEDSLGKVQKSVNMVGNSAQKASKKTVTAFNNMRRGLEGASNRIGRAFRGTFGMISATLGVGGFIGIVGKSIKAAGSFETALREVSTLIGGNATVTIKRYEKAIRELALNSSADVNTLTAALYQTISAGVAGSKTVEGSMELVKVAQEAAVAGVSDARTAVDVLTTSLNAYSMSTDNAVEFSDKLFTAVKLGKTTFGELSSQLGMVASIAAGAGVEFGEVNAALAAMTKGGLSTDIATTALRATIVSLLKPSKDMQRVLKKNGFESATAAIKSKGLLGVMEMMKEATGGNSEKLQKLIPNVRALTGVSIIAGTGIDNFRHAVDEMKNSTGATAEAYGKMANTFEERSKRFRNLINEVFLKVGKQLLPFLLDKMEEISEWVDKNGDKIVRTIKNLVGSLVELIEYIIKWGPTAAKILGSIWVVGKISNMITSVQTLGSTLSNFMSKLPHWLSTFSLFSVGLGAAAIAANGLASALSNARKEGKKMVDDLREAWSGVTVEALGTKRVNQLRKSMRDVQFYSDQLSKMTADKGEEYIKEAVRKANESVNKAGELFKKLAADIRSGKYDKEALEQMRKRYEALTGDPGEEMPIIARTTKRGRKLLLDSLASMYEEIHQKVIQNSEKESELTSQLNIRNLEEQLKNQDNVFKVEQKHLDALAEYRVKGMDLTSKANLALLRKMAKNEIDVAGQLDDKNLKTFNSYLKARFKALQSAINEERKLQEESFKYLQDLRRSQLDEEVKLRFNYQQDIQKIDKMHWENEDQKEEALYVKKIQFANKLNEIAEKRLEKEREFYRTIEEEFVKASESYIDFRSEQILAATDKFGEEAVAKALGVNIPKPTWLERLGSFYKEELQPAFEEIGIGFLRKVGEGLFDVFMNLSSVIMKPFSQIMDIFNAALSGKGIEDLTKMLEDFISFWENLSENLGPIIEWIVQEGMPRLIDAFVNALPNIIDALISQLPNITRLLVDGALRIVAILISKLPEIINAVVEMIPMIVAAIIENIPTIALEVGKAIVKVIKRTVFGEWDSDSSWLKGEEGLLPNEIPVLGKLHQGGMITMTALSQFNGSVGRFQNAIRAHSGLFVEPNLSQKEVPIIAKVGEAVMNEDWVRNVGGKRAVDQMNKEGHAGSMKQPVINNVVNNHLSVQHLMSRDTRKVIDDMMTENLRQGVGGVSRRMKGKATPGFVAKKR